MVVQGDVFIHNLYMQKLETTTDNCGLFFSLLFCSIYCCLLYYVDDRTQKAVTTWSIATLI